MKVLLRIYYKFNIAVLYDTSTKKEESVDLDDAIKILKEGKEDKGEK